MSNNPVDLEIRVSAEDSQGATHLHYVLHSPSGKVRYTHFRLEGGTEIQSQPQEYQERMLSGLASLGRGLSANGIALLQQEVTRELEAIGRELFRDLFSRALKVEYEYFRERVSTLLIISDEPWIPWELIRPTVKGVDDDFLSCRFAMTRWLAGEAAPAEELKVDRITCFEAGQVPGAKPLPHAVEESRMLHDLAERQGDVDSLIVADADYEAVTGNLQIGGAGILHFVGHGEFDPRNPNTSRFLLNDGRNFRPRDLSSAIESKIRQDRPLVFFNSCQVAQQSYTLSRLGGWAPRWILDSGCGAFLGPQWDVKDTAARLFAETFYTALEHGETVAQAALKARLNVRKTDPASAVWLAYAVYAHPNAMLRLGSRLPGPPKPQPRPDPPPETPIVVPPTPRILPPTAIARTLGSVWTFLGSLHLIFVGVMFLRNRSLPVFPGLKEFLQGDVAAFLAVFFGLPIFYLSLYAAMKYCDTVELRCPAHDLSFMQRISLRLPVAFKARVRGLEVLERAYQTFFLFIFIVAPMILQIFLFIRLMQADVWIQREQTIFSSTLQESLTKYVPWKEAFLNDNFRIGSMDVRPGVEKIVNNVTYFPFWQSWGFLLAEFLALGGVLRLFWKLGSSKPHQRRQEFNPL